MRLPKPISTESITEVLNASEIKVLKESEPKIRQNETLLLAEWDKPLEVNEYGHITAGVLWINGPFATEFWKNARKKPKPTKCVCQCGNKHNVRQP